jgi:hypothetical protein
MGWEHPLKAPTHRSQEEPYVIVTQNLKKDQLQQRLNLKSAEQAFCRQIVGGTNCSSFESQIIVEKAKEIFALGEHAEGRVLQDGQMVFFAVGADSAPGVGIAGCSKRRVVLTHLQRSDDLAVLREHGASAKRRQQLLRMAVEAQEQGALLTQEDLALILDSDVRTIRADIRKLSREQQIAVPTRGTVRDIGPGVTHKVKAVQLWLSGKEALEVARQLNHSLKAVERYIQTFCRVVYAQRRMRDLLKTALVVGISVASASNYWQLHCELVKDNSFYRERLQQVLSLGEQHWVAADGKKSPSPRPGPGRRG